MSEYRLTGENRHEPIRLLLDCWKLRGDTGVKRPGDPTCDEDEGYILQAVRTIISQITGEPPEKISSSRAVNFLMVCSAEENQEKIDNPCELVSKIFNPSISDALSLGATMIVGKGRPFMIYQRKQPEINN